ncbi:PP2C family protein-serine/threonine phosphatase [Hyalangium versicolor]|uniref:PP2C family protein-serine/threonine phosphatase n=1 Tax=Hyalangium versicolor TaxID=2861190 RepID=UPI001CCE5CF9|nr:fused response regulator/phosphatase [Hyalangium versicolor]
MRRESGTFKVSTIARPRRVLVVDDSPTTCALFSGMLEREGMIVTVAVSGEQALASAKAHPPDLILLDYMMPDITGPNVAMRMRADPRLREVPIILVTASSLESTMEEAFAAGADDYLIKPVARPLLLSRISAAIRASESSAAARNADAILQDLEEARQVQQSLLPKLPAQFSGWQVSGAVVSCSMVGGDMLDVTPGTDGAQVVSLVDVAGHGTGAALVAAQVSSELRMLVETRPLAEAMMALSFHMAHRGTERYACVAAAEMRGGQITIINAGLPPVCVLRRGMVQELVSASAVPPGLIEDPTLVPTRLKFEPGDCLVMLSDGLTEPFGPANVVLPGLAALGLLGMQGPIPEPRELVRRIQERVGQVQQDDATLLVLERLSGGA